MPQLRSADCSNLRKINRYYISKERWKPIIRHCSFIPQYSVTLKNIQFSEGFSGKLLHGTVCIDELDFKNPLDLG